MSLQAGHKLAHYEILEPIGRGGMGDVYRAKDGKLGRDVAIKVLPDEFAQDEERLRRFQREAKVLASLNHPNVASIYGLEQSGDMHYLVLELVPGETLAERIARGPIPVEEALEIATKIAEALEEAHERGIVHRDLKPANVKLTPDGKVKVLDFGLAKVFAEESAEGDVVTSMSPTITRDATRVGVILGTVAYMSPEQAKGKSVDKRTDIFAFGAVLYEMLSGRKAFPGDDVSDVLASVIKSEPDWGALPASVTPRFRELLHRCLRKDPSVRLRDIGDGRYELQAASAQNETTLSRSQGLSLRSTILVMTVLAVGVLGGAILTDQAQRSDGVARFTVMAESPVRAPALSADGRILVFESSGTLYLRPIDERDARPIPGTNGGRYPFFSPDGQWVAFFEDASLYRVRLAGGSPESIAFIGPNRGGAWGADGTIIVGRSDGGLIRVPDDGGPLENLTTPKEDETSHRWPRFLPDGRHVLFTAGTNQGPRVAIVSLDTGVHWTLTAGYGGRYLSTGQLVFVRDGRLLAAPFSISELKLRGAPVPLPESVLSTLNAGIGFANYAFSSTGSLVYVPGGEKASDRNGRLVWVSRGGGSTPLGDDEGNFIYPRLSPDGEFLAVSRELEIGRNLWLYDVERGTKTRFSFAGSQFLSVWTPDGRELAFSSDHAGRGIYIKPIDEDGAGTPLSIQEHIHWPTSWSPDGRLLAFQVLHPETRMDIWILPRDNGEKPIPFARSSHDERAPTFSPDGRYLAFVSSETGRDEIYVQPFPGPGGKRIVSTDGGREPVWSRDGKELFYRLGASMLSVHVELSPELHIGQPEELFEGNYQSAGFRFPNYDVAADGRFVMIESDDDYGTSELEVVLNWTNELKRLVPSDN